MLNVYNQVTGASLENFAEEQITMDQSNRTEEGSLKKKRAQELLHRTRIPPGSSCDR